MSTSYQAQLYVGALVETSDFYAETGEVVWSCGSGHIRKEGEQIYCPQCGLAFKKTELKAPTEVIQNAARLAGEAHRYPPTHGQVWEAWQDGTVLHLSLFRNLTVDGGKDHEGKWILGMRLDDRGIDTWGVSHFQRGITQERLAEAIKLTTEALARIGLGDRPVELFLAGSLG